jgi:hypothetical protein
MPRRAKPTTAHEKIASVIQLADRQGFKNIATELREALALLPEVLPTRKRPVR